MAERTEGARRLKEWIARAHLTQHDTAVQLGVDKTFINQLVSGRRTPGLPTAKAIQDLTGIPAVAWVPITVDRIKKTRGAEGRNDKVA